MKRKIKQLIKKVLIRLHLMKDSSGQGRLEKEKTKPDFDIKSRKMPEYINRSGEFKERLDDQENPKIAIQIHAFFLDVLPEVVEVLNTIPYPYDCYVSTDTTVKKAELERVISNECSPCNLKIDVMENRGRDVGPFLQQMAPIIDKYEYLAHLHTKKSKHTDFGDDWRHFLYRNMFGSRESVLAILERFENNPKLGLVVPEVYPIVRELMAWDNTKDDVNQLLEKLGLSVELPDTPMCPVGDIFWARVDAVKSLFKQGITQEDFQEEAGQLNYTLAHVIERIWCYLVMGQGYEYEVLINGIEPERKLVKPVKRALIYACTNRVTNRDIEALRKYKNEFDYILLGGTQDDINKYGELADDCTILEEKDSINYIWYSILQNHKGDLVLFDEIALSSNRAFGPVFEIQPIMNNMSCGNYKVWSVFKDCLSNTMFAVFDVHQNSIEEIGEQINQNDVIDENYVKESAYINDWLFTGNAVDELSFDYVILHSPYISKKSSRYMGNNESVLMNNFVINQVDGGSSINE